MKNKKIITILLNCSLLFNSTIILCRSQDDLPSSISRELDKLDKFEFESKLHDTKFLGDIPAVEELLKPKGFSEVTVKARKNICSQETLNISTFAKLNTNDIKKTFLIIPGFLRGRGLDMVPRYKDEKDVNYMFVDTRGKGRSEGLPVNYNLFRAWKGIQQFGEHEYLDVAACVQKIVTHDKQHQIQSRIYLQTLCAGTYNSIKALKYLKDNDFESYQAVEGIVFDSGWAKITDIAESSIQADSAKLCKKRNISFAHPIICYGLKILYKRYFQPHYEKQTPITDIIKEIDQKVLFIHATDDQYVSFDKIEPLIENTRKKEVWKVPHAKHGFNHLIEEEEYDDKVNNFTNE
ncbi:hypothetical protein KBC04_01125 [Candidatus Babeliales bacterium]|nr:hypothetical protein [Candidatus Babeliales bacterium]MBP9843666.1 hypothetical protein [Candidatus Babeliales bacterium]